MGLGASGTRKGWLFAWGARCCWTVPGRYVGHGAEGFLSLYEVTGDREWLKHAEEARLFLAMNFAADSDAGFVTSKAPTDHAYKPHRERDDNVQVARFATLLSQYNGSMGDTETATRAMKYLVTHEVAVAWLSAPVLLAEMEFTHAPIHITVEGHKGDSAAKALFQTALRAGPVYKRVEWWDPSEGMAPRDDVQYPKLVHAAAFLCTATACSSPITDAKALEDRIKKVER